MMQDKKVIIPVVFATDDNYIIPTYVSIFSMLNNAYENTFYDIYILVPGAISELSINLISSLNNGIISKCNIKFINMGDKFTDLKMKISHITSPTFYRLCLSDILPYYDKCIYLDSDILVKQDLTQLFNQEIQDFYVAGVKSAGIQIDQIYSKALCERIGLPDTNNYINAGVLVINLQKVREENVTQKLLQLSQNEFPAQDQDIINLAFYGKIKSIPLKFNVMTKCNVISNKNVIKAQKELTVYTVKEVEEAISSPVIIHYADRIKPWALKNSVLAFYWWDCVKSISNNECKQAIISFSENAKVPRETIYQAVKRCIIRISQIIGLYNKLLKWFK